MGGACGGVQGPRGGHAGAFRVQDGFRVQRGVLAPSRVQSTQGSSGAKIGSEHAGVFRVLEGLQESLKLAT
jgi:hypothetical protein